MNKLVFAMDIGENNLLGPEQHYKRELMRACTLSVEETSQIIGVSATAIKQLFTKNKSDFTIKFLSLADLDIEKLKNGSYAREKIGVVIEPRGSQTVAYRLFFHAIQKLIEKVFSRYSQADLGKYVALESEKIELRKKLLLELLEGYRK